jgi:hypothetical protein
MKLRSLLPLVLLTGFAAIARGDLRLLASATSDSYQSLTYGLSAFCQAAGFPFALTEINDKASDLLLVPNLAGVDVQQHLWLLWLLDEQKNRQAPNIMSVAILPTADNAAATVQALANAYPLHAEEETQQLIRYAVPPEQAAGVALPVLYIAVRHGAVIASASREATIWVAGRPLPAPPAGVPAAAGQVRFEIHPEVAVTLLAASGDLGEGSARLRDLSKCLLADIRALTLVLETTTEGITARLAVTPTPNTRLARLIQRIHPPENAFWQMCPDQATVAIASGGASIWRIPDAYATTNEAVRAHNAETVLGDCLTGDSVQFIGRASATGSLYYAEIMGITNRAVAWNRALADPQALLPFETSFGFVTNGTHTLQDTPVLDLVRGGFVKPGGGKRNLADMAAFMVRDGGISVAATSNNLVVTFGATNAIEQILLRLGNPETNAMALPARCQKLLPDLPDAPCSAMLFQPAGLVRQIAMSLPGLKPEQVAALPQPGDGVAAATTRDAAGVLHLTLRVSANEVARLKDGMSKGHDALQELFMQMALQQMLQMERKLDASDPRDPKSQMQR